MAEFARRMRILREQSGLTLRGLAKVIPLDPGHLSRIESGTRQPTGEVAVAIDSALNAGGELYAVAPRPDPASQSVQESEQLTRLLLADGDPDEHLQLAEVIAIDYLGQPAPVMLRRARAARRGAVASLRRSRHRSPDTVLAAGQMSGVLAYAALDMGDAAAALAHAQAAWAAAEAAGDDELRAWVRGTQSLIERFRGGYVAALRYAEDGLRYAPEGSTARPRLLAGIAQCSANLRDARETHRALRLADDARESVRRDGPGVFGFSEAKQAYYTGSSLIWLPEPGDAALALAEAGRAIRLWQHGAAAERSLDDEALAHVYAATAAVTLGELDQVAEWLEPILSLPEERRISWVRKRLLRIAGMLVEPRYASSQLAHDLVDRIAGYVDSAVA